MSLLFNVLSRLISFPSKEQVSQFHGCSHHLQWFWSQENKVVTVSIVSPSICHEVTEPNGMILVFWMLSFKPAFSLSSFTFIKSISSKSISSKSSSLLSAIWMVSSTYWRLLIFLPEILIPACSSSSPAFLTMYSAYKLNRVTTYSLDVLLSQFQISL